MSDYDFVQRRLSEGYGRQLAFLADAIREGRPPAEDWYDALSDAIEEIDRIVRREAHPDDVASARLAVSALTGIWLDVDQAEDLYLGGPAEGEDPE